MQDAGYRDFQSGLIPGEEQKQMIGVRTPQLRNLAKQLAGRPGVEVFLNELPHPYFEQMQLHAFLISGIKDFETCIKEVCKFLPYVDNWATCDQMSPKVFKKKKQELLPYIREWIASPLTFTVRFAIGMLMEHFLDADFSLDYPKMVAQVRSEEYYINMMIAWYFATALAKQYEQILPFLTEQKLDVWTHNKTIQKAIESRRISEEQKTYLRSLKIKNR